MEEYEKSVRVQQECELQYHRARVQGSNLSTAIVGGSNLPTTNRSTLDTLTPEEREAEYARKHETDRPYYVPPPAEKRDTVPSQSPEM